ncbi:MAG TPA: PGPGW domain-containing protein [Thermoanaerobaculaceae bacterium]|nr:PGPGW domain-containing protein [Thermoanaerobaculaceae bacterium]HRS15179.1 PGPGW domain-containing protein [Thermoanaerobaculaceae bacterium]
MKGVLRHVAGWTCLLLGVAGLFLPVLQGWLLIGLGALLLSPDVPLFRRLVSWIERRSPALERGIGALRKKLRIHR